MVEDEEDYPEMSVGAYSGYFPKPAQQTQIPVIDGLNCPFCGGKDSIVNNICQMPDCGRRVISKLKDAPRARKPTKAEVTLAIVNRLRKANKKSDLPEDTGIPPDLLEAVKALEKRKPEMKRAAEKAAEKVPSSTGIGDPYGEF